MKSLNQILLIATLAAASGLAYGGDAPYRVLEEDGIAASPKFRQLLNERKQGASVPSMAVGSLAYRPTGDDGIAASPRLRQQLHEQRTVASTSSSAYASVGYRPTGDDGIASSPRLRQQLNERGPTFMIAPVK